MYRLPIVLILLAGLCFGCGTRQDTAQNTDGMTRLLLTKETEATPADFIADYRYVPLGTTRQPVGNIDQLLVTDDRIIVVDKEESPGGYPATVLSRLTWDCKLRQGAEPGAVMRKELSLSGVQRPLYKGELGPDAVEVFRFGDFAGWLIEGKKP